MKGQRLGDPAGTETRRPIPPPVRMDRPLPAFARALGRILTGTPRTSEVFTARTVEPDDLEIARVWLDDRSTWRDEQPVDRYASEFAAWNGSKAARPYRTGREALSACLAILGLEAGDEVIVPGYTCVTVPNAIRFANLEPVFADIELDTYGIDVDSVEQRITDRTRVILLQHLYGLVARDYEAVVGLARSRGIRVIEDCAHSAGAKLDGIHVGNRGDLAFYSSERSKVYCTVMGGMAVTNDEELATALADHHARSPRPSEDWTAGLLDCLIHLYRQFRDPQRWWRGLGVRFSGPRDWVHSTSAAEERGRAPSDYGQAMAPAAAALGRNQLAKLDRFNRTRRETARLWGDWCDRNGIARPQVVENSEPIHLRYPVLVEPERKRDLSWARRALGFTPGVWFVGNLHPVPHALPDCPRATEAVARCINLPTLVN